ncbi:MAG: hypothetical protein ACKVT2_04150 [Saprospiraceae bacterium]
MRITLLFAAYLLLITLVSCKDKNKSIYEGCCGTKATVDTSHITLSLYGPNNTMFDTTVKALVYIPNIFVIDTTGVFVYDGGWTLANWYSVNRILSAVYSSEDGEILFVRENFKPNYDQDNWDGLKQDGTYYQGVFNYRIVVAFEGVGDQTKTYIGKACVYLCGSDGFPNENRPNCFFPYQHDGYGGFDPNQTIPIRCL